MIFHEEHYWSLRQVRPETGESLGNFKNYPQLPNIYYYLLFLLIFLTFHGPQSSPFIHLYFFCSGSSGFLGESISH